jgi:hypothetical protein
MRDIHFGSLYQTSKEILQNQHSMVECLKTSPVIDPSRGACPNTFSVRRRV